MIERRALLLGGAVALAAPAHAADRMNVVATFSVLADWVGRIGGDQIALVTFIGPDGDSETYTATAGDVPRVANARIVFMNGLNDGFEPWLDPLLKQARFSGMTVIASRGVKAISAEDEHPVGGKPKASALDQHAWMDPRNAVIYVKNIGDALVRADPANADLYRSRAAAYTKALKDLNTWVKAEVDAVPVLKRRVLLSHDSLQYLA